jgi:CMP-N,N'-diacetyllegionaminic acid synthase
MYKNKKVLAIIPARGGSKGVKLKNLREINGKSLIEYASDTANKTNYIDKAIISTDHNDIVKEANKIGLDVPFVRPEKLSGDRVSDIDVLVHALNYLEKNDNACYDIIVMLQPTSPMRTSEHIEKAIEMLVDDRRDAVWTVSETDSKSHPLKQLLVNNESDLSLYDEDGKNIIARQQLEPVYHRNGLVYAFTRECLLEQKKILGNNAAALIIEGIFISIDTLWDIKLTEIIMNESFSQ